LQEFKECDQGTIKNNLVPFIINDILIVDKNFNLQRHSTQELKGFLGYSKGGLIFINEEKWPWEKTDISVLINDDEIKQAIDIIKSIAVKVVFEHKVTLKILSGGSDEEIIEISVDREFYNIFNNILKRFQIKTLVWDNERI